MLLAELVRVSDAVGSTRSRTAKVAALAELLGQLRPEEVELGVALLAGRTRQGKVGVGWATLRSIDPVPPERPSLQLLEFDAAITSLESLSGPGSGLARRKLLEALFARAAPEEAEFIRRVLIGDLRQGAQEGVMAEAIARAAGVALAEIRRAAMLAGDLARVAVVALVEGEHGLAAMRLQVLRPVLPMLATTSDDVASAIAALGQCSIEWKLDGARIQAHRLGEEVRLYTRNLNDVTARLPNVVAVVRALDADQVVLDGEVIGTTDEGPNPFQETMSSFGRRAGPPRSALGAWFFDCLHVGGIDLLDRPLTERSAVLQRLAVPRVPSILTGDVAAALAFEAEALAAGHEGVMVKAASSPYEAGRRGAAWRKVKPVHTLDLVVLAAEWGSGRRRGWLSNLHLGARRPDGGFVMVGKTFKGLTDAMLTWQTAELLDRERSRHDQVVEVDPPLVVEIAVDGVQTSTRYAGGVALRFARVRRYRQDKNPQDADTLDMVRELLARPLPAPGITPGGASARPEG